MATILLVDDSPTLLLSMSGILEMGKHTPITAKDGETALDILKSRSDLSMMITDLNMPGMDGLTLIQEARKLSAHRFMPILMLTTESQQSKRNEAKAAGATGWLVKPIGAQDLLSVVQRLLPG